MQVVRARKERDSRQITLARPVRAYEQEFFSQEKQTLDQRDRKWLPPPGETARRGRLRPVTVLRNDFFTSADGVCGMTNC
jgi:hypothetical protein